jgi:hypothetical protein
MKPLAPLALLLLAACGGGLGVSDFAGAAGATRTSPWYESGPVTKPRQELIRTIHDLMTRCGYKPPEVDPADGFYRTEWDVQMSPRYRESFRTRLDVEVVRQDNGDFNVRTRSWMEVNNNGVNPSDPNKAEWVGAGVTDRHSDRINEPALRFHQMLKFRLFGLNE